MGTIISITMDEELAAFVQRKVDAGRYGSVCDVVEEALRLLKQREDESLEAVRTAIEEGEASGEPQPFDFEEFLRGRHAEIGRDR
jgi:antitoxin ParD1/3/4